MWQLLTHWQNPTCRKMKYRQEMLQQPCIRERRQSTVCSLLVTFFPVVVEPLGPLSDWGSWPHCRNRQKSHALHSRSAGNYIAVPTYFSRNSVFQCCALPTHSQFQSPHRNHSGHTFLLLLILRPWKWSTRAIIMIMMANLLKRYSALCWRPVTHAQTHFYIAVRS